MRDTLLAIQYVIIIGTFIEILIVFRKWKNSLQRYLFLNCISLLANSTGYLFEMKAQTEGEYITAVQLSYAGRVWIALSLFFFAAQLCRVKLPDILKGILVMVHMLFYVCILTLRNHGLYYTYYEFDNSGTLPRLIHGNGVVHHLLMVLQFSYIIIGMVWLFSALIKETNKNVKKRIGMVIMAVVSEAVFFVITIIGIPGVTDYYDLSMIGFFIGTVLMLIAILSFDLLGTREIAREFMIDRLSEGIIAVDRNGDVQYYNEHALEVYPELKTDPVTAFDMITQSVSNGGNIISGERIYSLEQNDLVYEGEYYGKVFALVDETDHIRYMDELKEQKELADSASIAKSRFLANMSHEIRTPINAVLGMDEMILRESKEKTIRSYAADIMSAGKTLLSLIGDILDLSKVEEGKMEIIPVQYDLVSLINDLSNMISDRAAKKGLRFEINVCEQIPRFLWGDEIRIRQCVLNILTNAVKYTDQGSVILNILYEENDEDHIMLQFSVADTGIGMQKKDMDVLFSPYQRLEEKRNRTIEGTGLGMTITRQLLDLMGSGLSVESEYGRGSVFSFEIEQKVVSREEIGDYSVRFNETRADDYTYHELFHAPSARILVVDDTEMNLTVMQNLLKKTQIRIDTAMSGRDALTLAAVNRYNVIFIDHMMPEMDGIETLEHLRKEGKNQDTPVVALTANAVSGARQKYLAAGFADYLSKPIDGARLEKMLKDMLPEDLIELAVSPENDIIEEHCPERFKILVIDDDESVCALVKSIMEPEYEIRECLYSSDAVRIAKELMPDLIMLDIHLSDGNGFEVMQELNKESATEGIPVLLITGDNDSTMEENGFRSGASDYVRKPFVPDVLIQRTKRIIALNHYQQSVEKEVRRQTQKSGRLSREMMFALSKTVDTKDHYTDGHSRRVAAISAEIGRRLGKSGQEQVELYEIGLLHDIGKIGVHEDIIRKNSRLTNNEFVEIKEHTVNGYEILKEITDMPKLREGARWHHERLDGSGYPDGLKGEEIPETARIVCVADCYDAMTSTRSYSVPRKQEDVRAEIERCRGMMFDPQIADVLIAMIDEDKEYRMNENAKSAEVWKEYDRLWGNMNIDEAVKDPKNALPEWLLSVNGLNTDMGLKNCGSADGFLSVISVFHQTALHKADEIEEYYREGDIANYTIKVHALKSSARIIGATGLSKLAEELEEAGKAEDREFINNNTERLLETYRGFNEGLSKLSEKTGDLPDIEAAALKEAYQTIKEIAQSMDYELMEEAIKNLKTYRMPVADVKNVRRIEDALNRLEWDEIERTAIEAYNAEDY